MEDQNKRREVFTVEEVAEILRFPKRTVYVWLQTGQIKGMKVGRHWRVPRSEMEKLVPGLGVTLND